MITELNKRQGSEWAGRAIEKKAILLDIVPLELLLHILRNY
jgi:hypothetical protein